MVRAAVLSLSGKSLRHIPTTLGHAGEGRLDLGALLSGTVAGKGASTAVAA